MTKSIVVGSLLLLLAVVIVPIAATRSGAFAEDKPKSQEIAALFDRWNDALMTLDPEKVADLYTPHAVLLPTLSNTPRNTRTLIVDYFEHFLRLKPVGKIDKSYISTPCPKCGVNSGLYTFHVTRDTGRDVVRAWFIFEYHKIDGEWLITQHHSSALPEAEMPSEVLVASFFGAWNAALRTLNATKVAALYAPDAVLLPTVSNVVRTNQAGIINYFEHFLDLKPAGTIIEQHIMIPSATLAFNSGVYVFNVTRETGPDVVVARYTFVYRKYGSDWLIAEHHSSAMPEQKLPSENEIAALFDQWNDAVETRDPEKVADLYADDAILLPTLSNLVRTNRTAIVDYFKEFLANGPSGTILESHISALSPTLAMNNGVYRFDFSAGDKNGTNATARYSFVYRKHGANWLIEEHHSSKMPEP